MGLDIGFYRDGEEVFSLRNHDAIFEALVNGSGGDVDDVHSDFYVTDDTLDVVDDMLADERDANDVSDADVLTEIPEKFHSLDGRYGDWKELLLYYPAVIEFLRKEIDEGGDLICSWSA